MCMSRDEGDVFYLPVHNFFIGRIIMRRPFRKAVAFIVFLAMALQLVNYSGAEAAAKTSKESDFEFTDGYISAYKGTDKNVVIPESLGATSVAFIDAEFESVTVPEGVTSLTLSCLDNLKKAVLPSTMEYLYIYRCGSLKEIDLTAFNGQSNAYTSISTCDKLEKIIAGSCEGTLYVESCNKLKNLDLSASSLSYAYISYCSALETLQFGAISNTCELEELPALKSALIPNNVSSLYIIDTPFDGITLVKQDKDGYFIKNGGLYRYETDWDETTHLNLKQVDVTKEKIDVIDGTQYIGYLGLSTSSYRIKTINLPDSIEYIGAMAFEGAHGIEELTLPKNVISIGYYAFAESAIKKIVIPKSVTGMDEDAFALYDGEVELEEGNPDMYTFADGIYDVARDYNGNELYTTLVYYPSDKKEINIKEGTNYIGSHVFYNTQAKTLKIPEGVTYVNLLLYMAPNLTSLSLPSSTWYISPDTVLSAPNLMKLSVGKDNSYYESYKNCLYDKGRVTFIAAPLGISKVVIPEGVLSLSAYAIRGTFRYLPEEEYVKRTYYLPRSIENYPEYIDSVDFEKCYLYADNYLAYYLQRCNEETRYWADEYGYEPTGLYDYEFRDSNKDILNMIYVVDSMTIKKGGEEYLDMQLPFGLDFTTKLSRKNNTEVQVKLSSSDKKVAKIDSKTGLVKGIKKGTCTINVKCTIDNGKKKNTKTFKVKIKVK